MTAGAELRLPDQDVIDRIVEQALAEDLAGGRDVTTEATVPAGAQGRALFVPRAPGVVAGLEVAARVFELTGPGSVRTRATAADGQRVQAGEPVLEVVGALRTLLTAERTALNLLGHLSGVATFTRSFVDAVAGTGATVLDTRKTLPGLRALQKYAVRAGGGANKRMSLTDGALVKDNHVLAAGGLAAAFAAVRRAAPDVDLQVECDTVQEVEQALEAGADFILCDNMDLEQLGESVRRCRGRARVEATGGVTLARAPQIAATGVDFLSVGALTASAPSLDIGMDLDPPGSAAGAG